MDRSNAKILVLRVFDDEGRQLGAGAAVISVSYSHLI